MLAGRVAPAAALGSMDTSGAHEQAGQASNPAGQAAEQPTSMGRAAPPVASQSSQPGTQGDAACADLASAAAVTTGQAEEGREAISSSSGGLLVTEGQSGTAGELLNDMGACSRSDTDDASELALAHRNRWINGRVHRAARIVRAAQLSIAS